MTLFILADDLTGAADTAARCHQAGLPATIYVQSPAPPFLTGVRLRLPLIRAIFPLREAARCVAEIVAQLPVAHFGKLRSRHIMRYLGRP